MAVVKDSEGKLLSVEYFGFVFLVPLLIHGVDALRFHAFYLFTDRH